MLNVQRVEPRAAAVLDLVEGRNPRQVLNVFKNFFQSRITRLPFLEVRVTNLGLTLEMEMTSGELTHNNILGSLYIIITYLKGKKEKKIS